MLMLQRNLDSKLMLFSQFCSPSFTEPFPILLFLTDRALFSAEDSDLSRIPLIIEPGVFAFSTVVLVSSLVSALIVARRLTRLDLVEVLKTRE